MKNLGVVIPVYNQLFYTKQCIESLRKVLETTNNVEDIWVIIVNNNSTDETLKWLRTDYIDLHIISDKLDFDFIDLKENKGYGGGANEGIKYLQEAFPKGIDVIVCNNDLVFLDNCIEELISAAYSKDDIGVVGAKLLFPDMTIQHAGAYLNTFGWGQHYGGGIPESEYIDVDKITEMEFCTGALLYIRKEATNVLVEKEGSVFDERFFMYFEETDASYVLRKYGYKTVYTPLARALHFEGQS